MSIWCACSKEKRVHAKQRNDGTRVRENRARNRDRDRWGAEGERESEGVSYGRSPASGGGMSRMTALKYCM